MSFLRKYKDIYNVFSRKYKGDKFIPPRDRMLRGRVGTAQLGLFFSRRAAENAEFRQPAL